MTYESVNPSTGQCLHQFAELRTDALEQALATAYAAFGAWKHRAYASRAVILEKAASLLRADVDRFARLATEDMGKRIAEARAEVLFSADILAYYARHAGGFLKPKKLHPTSGAAILEASPLGVLFCVEPWNFPYYQLARVAGPHLMSGNTVMVKPAAIVPQVAIAFAQLMVDAGAPVGVYTNLLISHAQADQVIDDPRIAAVCLTGSVGAGRSIAARAGRNLKKTSMELGGSGAFIVLDDADLAQVIPWAVWGRMYNAGQTCCASKRFIVLDAIADQFLARFAAAVALLQPGDPMEESTTHGPVSSEAALTQLLSQIDAAVAHGANVLMGGKRLDRPGAYLQVTILGAVKADNPAFRDEFFGPVALFFRVRDEAAAIALANHSDFGLGGCVFTRDMARGHRVASAVDTGTMFINNIDWLDADLPFGGIKLSGYGRELGDMGIQEFVNWTLVQTADHAAPG